MAEEYKERAAELLKKAKIGDFWTNPRGITRYDIVVDDEIIGHLQEKIDLKDVEVGYGRETWMGWKVNLVHNGEVVGNIVIRK